MKNQHRKLAVRGETIRALAHGQLIAAQGGAPKTGDPQATFAGCPVGSGGVCRTDASCHTLDCR
jgi:hypothetical protein